ncbi:MAG: Holliday junction branch migration protein RuvA [Nitrospirota bacterium]
MIASLNGIIASKSLDVITVDVGGVGYQVFIPLSTYYHLPDEKSPVSLHIHTYVREDALHLYGFLSLLEKKIFLLLIGVSGVGPKLARNIMSGMELSDFISVLKKGSLDSLRKIPGIGPKMAGRLVLELKEKVESLETLPKRTIATSHDLMSDDLLSALLNLGYTQRDAKRAIDQILTERPLREDKDAEENSVEVLIKQALRLLSKGGKSL